MKKELLEYATYTEIYKNKQKTNYPVLFSNIVVAILALILMAVSSIPLLLSKLWLWIVLLALWIFALLYSKIEKNDYMRAILIDGMYLTYVSLFLSYILVNFVKDDAGNSLSLPLIIVTVLFLTIYEIVVIIQIIKKKYSNPKQSKNEGNNLISTLSLVGAFSGILLYKLFSKSISYSMYQIIFIVIIGSMWLCAFILLQKYFILKVLNFR